jgi:hypothetical protein
MRRFTFVMVLAILLQACSGISIQDMLNPPTKTPTITKTPTVTFTPTITSTATITPTITPTTTIVHIPTQDPNQPTATFIPIPIFVGDNTITPIATPTEFRPGPGFLSVTVPEKKIFWGSCKHNKTTITAEVENPEDVFSVVIFVRTKSLKKEDYTPWTTGDVMHSHRNGTYSYTLVGSNIEGHNHYKDSWVFFQLVATDVKGKEIGRTMIFTNSISLSPCQ